MSTILVIHSSALSEGSQSRRLTQRYIEGWKQHNSSWNLRERDLAADPLPHLDGRLLAGLGLPEEEREADVAETTARAERLVEEFLAADEVVIGVPMYNFSIPSTLKAYIDHIAQAGRTFRYTEQGPVGLCGGKRMTLISTRGGVYDDSPMDHQVAYLKALFGFLGIEAIEVINAEGLNMGEESAQQSLAAAEAAVDASAATRRGDDAAA